MTAHAHIWEMDFAGVRDAEGRYVRPHDPPLWECMLCDATYRGEVAPDGTTFEQASDAYHEALDRASLA